MREIDDFYRSIYFDQLNLKLEMFSRKFKAVFSTMSQFESGIYWKLKMISHLCFFYRDDSNANV